MVNICLVVYLPPEKWWSLSVGMESHKIHVPNLQPVLEYKGIETTLVLAKKYSLTNKHRGMETNHVGGRGTKGLLTINNHENRGIGGVAKMGTELKFDYPTWLNYPWIYRAAKLVLPLHTMVIMQSSPV